MAQLPVYSSRDVQISWAGYNFCGLAPDSLVTFSRNTPITDYEAGADGKISISINPDESGTCTVALQQQSETNNVLAGILEFQKLQEPRVIVQQTLTVSDPSGSVLARLENAHLMEFPEVGLGSSATGSNREWTFFCEKLTFIGVPDEVGVEVAVANRIAAGIDLIKSARNIL